MLTFADNIGNIYEHAANTGVGIAANGTAVSTHGTCRGLFRRAHTREALEISISVCHPAVSCPLPSNAQFLATFDGYDGCPEADSTCGTNAYTLGYFFKDYLGVAHAMGMDQGGSTTMWLSGGRGVVSKSSTDGGVRPVFNGLFLVRDA